MEQRSPGGRTPQGADARGHRLRRWGRLLSFTEIRITRPGAHPRTMRLPMFALVWDLRRRFARQCPYELALSGADEGSVRYCTGDPGHQGRHESGPWSWNQWYVFKDGALAGELLLEDPVRAAKSGRR